MAWRDYIVSDVRAVGRHASTWVLAVLLPFPDIYNVAVGWAGYADIPSNAKHVMYAFSLAGLAAKVYRQKGKETKT